MNTKIEVPAGGAWFEGHFPGHPILPGVAELALALKALAGGGHAISLRGIAYARLRQRVFPGDHLELVSREAGPDRLRVDLKRDGILVANAEFILGAPEPSREQVTRLLNNPDQCGFPSLDALMPHRPPLRFLASVQRDSESGLGGTAVIPGTCALACGGSASPLAAVEAAAQAAAAWEALQRWRGGQRAAPRIGYLVALRDVVFFVARVPADREFTVVVELDAAAPPLTHYRIEVSLDGELMARGTIATFLTGG